MLLNEILAKADSLKTKKDKIAYLKQFEKNLGLKYLIRINFDSKLKSVFPEGAPPFTPIENPVMNGFREIKYLADNIVLWYNPSIKYLVKERTFKDTLEQIHPDEIPLVIACKDKVLTSIYKSLTKSIFEQVWPDFIK